MPVFCTDRSLATCVASGKAILLGLSATLLLLSPVQGETTTQIVQGADGVTYQETRQVVERMVPVTEYQTREEKVYQPRTTTQYQAYQQNTLVPVTEYRWVARRRGVYNPFVDPYWAHSLEPVTRWESRPATVQMPVTKTEWVEQRRTVSTPVTTYKPVKEEHITKVAVNAAPTSPAPATLAPTSPLSRPVTSVASRPSVGPIGGRQLTSDPPRTATGWTSGGGSSSSRYR